MKKKKVKRKMRRRRKRESKKKWMDSRVKRCLEELALLLHNEHQLIFEFLFFSFFSQIKKKECTHISLNRSIVSSAAAVSTHHHHHPRPLNLYLFSPTILRSLHLHTWNTFFNIRRRKAKTEKGQETIDPLLF